MRTKIIILLLSLWTLTLTAQPEQGTTTVNQPPVATTGTVSNVPDGVNLPPVDQDLVPTKSTQEVWLSLGVLVFGIIVVLAQSYIIVRREEQVSQALKYLSVSLIIVGALFLVTAGYGNSQIAPIIGLLGTVAGYLLGRTQSPTGPPPGK